MNLGDKQKTLLAFAFNNDGMISKKEAIRLIGNCYYHNGAKYVGEVLSRLVKSGKLVRIKPGTYRLPIYGKDISRTAQQHYNNKQMDIFNQ